MATKKAANKTPAKAGAASEVTCDWCDITLGCAPNSPWDRDYWSLDGAYRSCDDCLIKSADDFPSMNGRERLFALRLLHVGGIDIASVDELIEQAKSVVKAHQVNNAVEFRRTAFELFRDGEKLTAMHAGQALWNACNFLHGALIHREPILAGRGIIEGRRKPKRPALQKWIEDQIGRNENETTREIWERAPARITDEIGFDRFTKRVSAARKTLGVGRK